MSNLEKLVTIAKNQEKVYDAGAVRFAAIEKSEKSEFVSVPDSSDYKVLTLELEGKTEQLQYSGKNLFDISKIETNGTLTNNGDGSLTVRHASNTDPIKLQDVVPNLVAGETYILTADTTGADKYFIVNGVLMKFGETFTVTEDMLNAPIRLYASYNTNGGSTTDTATISNIQIEEGDTATEYEPYTGGLPSPNPSYPQEIVNAGKTKNLFDISKVIGDGYYIINNLDGTLTINTDSSSSGITGVSPKTLKTYAPLLQIGESYTLNANTTSSRKYIYLVGTGTAWMFGESLVMTEEMLNSEVYWYADNTNSTAVISDIQIEEGTVATAYEPYGQYKINCTAVNKNLYNAGEISGTRLVGHQLGETFPAGTYILSANVESSDTDDTRNYILFRNSDLTLTTGAFINRGTRQSVTVTVDHEFSRLTTYASSTTTKSADDTFSFTDVMLERGEAASEEYYPHQSKSFTLTSPQPISKWDKLVKRDGVWGWSVNSHKRIYDGTEAWYQYGDVVALTNWDNNYKSPVHSYAQPIGLLSNIATEGTQGNANVSNDVISHDDGNMSKWIVFGFDILLEDWKTYLAEQYANGTPVYIMYPTAEEQSFIPLPENEQAILNKLTTYPGGTNIYTDQGCPIQIEYITDPDIYMSNGGES